MTLAFALVFDGVVQRASGSVLPWRRRHLASRRVSWAVLALLGKRGARFRGLY